MRGGLDCPWHAVALPALKAEAEADKGRGRQNAPLSHVMAGTGPALMDINELNTGSPNSAHDAQRQNRPNPHPAN